MTPSYLALLEDGTLAKVTDTLIARLASCDLCPRNCRVNRLEGTLGFCKTGRQARVSSSFHHYGEERELVGRGGSGTIFFAYCNLGCIYCQNYTLSHNGEGKIQTAVQLAGIMLKLQSQGAENINFVTPTHVIAQIVEAVTIAAGRGLSVPLVYNCGGYEKKEIIELLAGIFDIYMPDIKYADDSIAQRLSAAGDYWKQAQAAVKEMRRQVGDLVIEGGIAKKGLLVRHLVLPGFFEDSCAILDFIHNELSPQTFVNIMDQYHPAFKAYSHPGLKRRVAPGEYQRVVDYARSFGLTRGF